MSRFSRVLIANRAEIAVRIARTLRAEGYESVAVYSDPDRTSPHVSACDLAVGLPGAAAADTYLDIERILQAARDSGADAVHPGYGFLSENAEFARRCEAANLVFIGPSASAIAIMGSKRLAKQAVAEAGVRCIPGYEGAGASDDELLAQASAVGLPLMVKASAGGGGRGMRLVTELGALPEALRSARSEARNAFGSDELILERAITSGRHIEIQIAADAQGNVVHLGERDCSLQRRHQKVIEEAPSGFVTPALRDAMGEAAKQAARACDYQGLGTVEFLVAADGAFYFLEMNTRLQVEHPVTELVTGLDLVALQLQIAQGERLPLGQQDLQLNGHAIEARVYAEDPQQGFVPQTGTLLRWQPPAGEGLRVDSGVAAGGRVTPYYDPMLAKLIAWGASREQARQRLHQGLARLQVLGVGTNQRFLQDLLADPVFVAADATISYLDQSPTPHTEVTAAPHSVPVAAVVLLQVVDPQPMELLNWSNAEPMTRVRTLRINGVQYLVRIHADGPQYNISWEDHSVTIELLGVSADQISIRVNGVAQQIPYAADRSDMPALARIFLQWQGQQILCEDITYQPALGPGAASSGEVVASTEGLLVELRVEPGERVRAGQTLAVVEAMKMQHRHQAEEDGVVGEIVATPDTQVSKGQLLMTLVLDSQADAEAASTEEAGA